MGKEEAKRFARAVRGMAVESGLRRHGVSLLGCPMANSDHQTVSVTSSTNVMYVAVPVLPGTPLMSS
jgi:hypothetical protein